MLKKLLALLLAFTLVGGVAVAQDAEPTSDAAGKEEPAKEEKGGKKGKKAKKKKAKKKKKKAKKADEESSSEDKEG
jgi:hypothetical protein